MQRDGSTAVRPWRWILWGAAGLGLVALPALPVAACAGTTSEQVTGSTGSGGTAGAATTGSTTSTTTATATITGVTGGKLDTLSFAVVGDTRPPNVEDTAGYPTAVITKIWQDLEAQSPRPAFAVTTGDYMFTYGSQVNQQLGLYLTARTGFTNVVFPAMGNHECTGATTSNCGPGNKDGITPNFTGFLTKMLMPLGQTLPYYTVDVGSTSGAWTAKLVYVAANAWDTTQSTWLDAELAKPTTYTFVVRHESAGANTAPGVDPSEAIIAKHPVTLKIVGHSHTYQYSPQDHEVIVGNGGAPLSGGANYGYVIATQRADGAMVFNSYDYMTNKSVQTFVVLANGMPTN